MLLHRIRQVSTKYDNKLVVLLLGPYMEKKNCENYEHSCFITKILNQFCWKLIFQNPLHSTVCTTDINKEPIDDTEVAQSNNLVCRIRFQKIVLNAISILKEEGTHLTEMITSDMSKLSIPMLNVTVHIFLRMSKKDVCGKSI